MVQQTGNGNGQRASMWRIAPWAGAALLLLLPLVAMQFTDQMNWGVFDFVLAGALLFGAALAYELMARMVANWAYRAAVALALVAGLLLIVINLAVGVIGSEENPANLMFVGVLAVGLVGAILARLQAPGMARAMYATAAAQAVVAVVALIDNMGAESEMWPANSLVLIAFFIVLFVASGLFFQKATEQRPAGAR